VTAVQARKVRQLYAMLEYPCQCPSL
jgi:hypothetical protein